MGLVGQRLKELREEKDMSQGALGKLVNLSQQTIGHYEVGRSDPDTKTLELFAEIFNTTTDYLLGRSDKRYKNDEQEPNKLPYQYTLEDEALGLPPDWIEHLQFALRNGSKLTREEMDAYIALGRTFAARIERELKEKEKEGKRSQ